MPRRELHKRCDDHPEAELIATDERCEAGVGHAVGRPQPVPAHMRTVRGLSLERGSFGRRDAQRAREEVLG